MTDQSINLDVVPDTVIKILYETHVIRIDVSKDCGNVNSILTQFPNFTACMNKREHFV